MFLLVCPRYRENYFMLKRIKHTSGSVLKPYTGFIKYFKEELGWTLEKADALWHKRSVQPNWPRGVHPEDKQLTIAVAVEECYTQEEEYGHEAAVEAQNKDKRNVDPEKLQGMIGGLRSGPPGEKFAENMFDATLSQGLGLTEAHTLLQGPRAADFSNEAMSSKAFMLTEGLLAPEQQEEAKQGPDGGDQPTEPGSGDVAGKTPTKKFDPLVAATELKFNCAQAPNALKAEVDQLLPTLRKVSTELSGVAALDDCRRGKSIGGLGRGTTHNTQRSSSVPGACILAFITLVAFACLHFCILAF